ncbi:glycosyltransferase [Mesorhizobium sp. SB112]|uniref:glycosyltransferase n=1 Tax=Mesorhizobium sp. SB112 TaxID=3151853 RepID=UPI0032632444
MNIWHFCPSPVDVSREQGGVANVVRALAMEHAASGISTTIICGDHELGRKSQEIGITKPMPQLRIQTVAQRANPALGPVAELRRIIDGMPDDGIAHVHTCFSAFTDVAMLSLRRRKIPLVFSPHGKLSAAMLKKRALTKWLWWQLLSKTNVAKADCIGLFAETEKEEMRSLGLATPSAIIQNGYAAPSSDAWKHDKPLIDGEYIIYLGYLDPRKQPDLLIRAFAKTEISKRIRLVLVGPDGYGFGETLRQEAKRLGVEDRVVFYGPAYGIDKWNLLTNAACLCLPSLAEGMPLVLAEALGAGTPSLFSAACNAGAIAKAGAGTEIPDNTEDAWTNAINAAFSDPMHLSSMRNAAENARKDFSWHGIATRWTEVYRQLHAQKASSEKALLPINRKGSFQLRRVD